MNSTVIDRKIRIRAVISLCFIGFISLSANTIGSSLPAIQETFHSAKPETIAAVLTLPSITAIPFSLLSGWLLGTYAKYRHITVAGLFLMLLGGVIPVLSTDITHVLAWRAVFGCGHGVLTPAISALTFSLLKGKDVANQFSRNTIAMNVGLVVMGLLNGFLCTIRWNLSFLVYLLVLPVLFMVILILPEPKTEHPEKRGRLTVKQIFTGHLIKWAILYFLVMVFFYPFATEVPGVFQRNTGSNAATSSIVMSGFTVAGVLGSILFRKLNGRLQKRVFGVGFGLCAFGYLLASFGNAIPWFVAAAWIFGSGYGVFIPAMNFYLGVGLMPQSRAASMSVNSVFSSFGIFSSAYVMTFLKSLIYLQWDRLSFIFGSIFFLICAAIFLFRSMPVERYTKI